jgi:chromatin remodeling complex protein RSC6
VIPVWRGCPEKSGNTVHTLYLIILIKIITMAKSAKTAAKAPAKKSATAPATSKTAGKPAAKAAGKPAKAAAKPAAKGAKAPAKPSAKPAAKSASGAATGLKAPLTPSEMLAKLVGNKPMPRTEVTKKVWEYIKKNDLQDKKNRRMINADENLKAICGVSQFSMFDLPKALNKHLK